MYNSDTYVKMLMEQRRFKRQKKYINDHHKVPSPSLLTSTYVPQAIKQYIEHNSKEYIHYSCRIFNRSISIYIIVFKKDLIKCQYLKVGALVEFECHVDKKGF